MGLGKAGIGQAQERRGLAGSAGVSDDGMSRRKTLATREARSRGEESASHQRHKASGRGRVTDGLVVPRKPGNSGGGKGPEFQGATKAARTR